MADHSSSISVAINLAALPPNRAGFSTVLMMVPFAADADLGSGTGDNRVVTYSSPAEVSAALAASDISAATAAALNKGFDQRIRGRRPKQIKVAYVDVNNVLSGGAETYVAALPLVAAADDDFYGVVTPFLRTDTDMELLSDAIESEDKRLYIAQSSDADWLTSSIPSEWDGVENERTAVLYHATDGAYQDVGYACALLGLDPAIGSSPAAIRVRSVDATTVTETGRSNILSHDANVGLAYSSASNFVQEGVSLAGRPLYQIVSGDWIKATIETELALAKLRLSDNRLKMPLNEQGAEIALAVVRQVFAQGVAGGHLQGDYSVELADSNGIDVANQKFNIEASAQILDDAVNFDITVNLSSDPVEV